MRMTLEDIETLNEEEFLETEKRVSEVTTTQLLSNMDGASVCPESFHFPDIRNVSG